MSDWIFSPLERNAYDLIVADPPWAFQTWSENGGHKSASKKYQVQHMDWIKGLPVADLADRSCLLMLWSTAPLLPEQIQVIEAWGFVYRSWLHWQKLSSGGRAAVGLGFRVRTMGELCLIATKNSPKHAPFPGNLPGRRREHSRKPEAFYRMLDLHCPDLTRRCDLFGRQSRAGFDVWGQEARKYDPPPLHEISVASV